MTTALPTEAFAAALASLPRCHPARLAALLRAWQDPENAWSAIRNGRLLERDDVVQTLGSRAREAADAWQNAARAFDVAEGWKALRSAGVTVRVLGAVDYPEALATDHEAPAVLFTRGAIDALVPPRVAIVGTRRCTHYGIDLARQFGRELAEAGVGVVSGLALGIDGAAHVGALAADAAAPIGVVGSGLDVVYPRRHAELWRSVCDRGILLTEAPLGARPNSWRFPARNRILAALGLVVVIVESHEHGGSMLTVKAAEERARTVMAVPGSVRSAASAGCNRLISEGVAPVRDTEDVIVALGLAGGWPSPSKARAPEVASCPTDPRDEQVLVAVDWSPTSTETVLTRTGMGLGPVAVSLSRLAAQGLVSEAGGWWERRHP